MTATYCVVAGEVELEKYGLELVDPRGELHDVAYHDVTDHGVTDHAESLAAARDLLAATPGCRDGHRYVIVGGAEVYVDTVAHPDLAGLVEHRRARPVTPAINQAALICDRDVPDMPGSVPISVRSVLPSTRPRLGDPKGGSNG
jgi:hypothetical protein